MLTLRKIVVFAVSETSTALKRFGAALSADGRQTEESAPHRDAKRRQHGDRERGTLGGLV